MLSLPPEPTSIFKLDNWRPFGSKLAATTALLFAGALFVVFTWVVLYYPGIATVLRCVATVAVSICWVFLATALVFLWFPKRCRRTYLFVERVFFGLLVMALPTLTAFVLWQAFTASK